MSGDLGGFDINSISPEQFNLIAQNMDPFPILAAGSMGSSVGAGGEGGTGEQTGGGTNQWQNIVQGKNAPGAAPDAAPGTAPLSPKSLQQLGGMAPQPWKPQMIGGAGTGRAGAQMNLTPNMAAIPGVAPVRPIPTLGQLIGGR